MDERDVARFWARTKRVGDCIEWQGCERSHGYGQFMFDHRRLMAHRAALELSNIRIPDGMEVGHRCDNKRCVNIDHLEIITHQENIKELRDRGAVTENEVTDKTIRDVKELHRRGFAKYQIAHRTGLYTRTVSRILNGEAVTDNRKRIVWKAKK